MCRAKITKNSEDQLVYIDGAGQRPDGTGSGYAFLNATSGKRHVKRVNGLTNNQAEWRALRYAVLNLPRGTTAKILSDSALVVNQFSGKWAVRELALIKLRTRVLQIIDERHLHIAVKWIPRKENLADGLL
jgi:ribonuclease HI